MEAFARSLFWRAVATTLAVAALLIGYGMVRPDGGLRLIDEANASHVAIGPKSGGSDARFVTASPDGRKIYEWGAKDVIIRDETGSCVQRPYVGLD